MLNGILMALLGLAETAVRFSFAALAVAMLLFVALAACRWLLDATPSHRTFSGGSA